MRHLLLLQIPSPLVMSHCLPPPAPGADLEEMVTDFRNNKRRRRKVLGGPGARFPGKFFFLRVIHKNLTNFRKTVETGMDPRPSTPYPSSSL